MAEQASTSAYRGVSRFLPVNLTLADALQPVQPLDIPIHPPTTAHFVTDIAASYTGEAHPFDIIPRCTPHTAQWTITITVLANSLALDFEPLRAQHNDSRIPRSHHRSSRRGYFDMPKTGFGFCNSERKFEREAE